MEGSNNDSVKLAKTADTGALTLGPPWLKQFAHSDNSKNSDSDGLTFQLAKHRYDRDDMLAIYEAIEKTLLVKPSPKKLPEFEELLQKELQRPVLLLPPTPEEQKMLSTCVNSAAALNAFNKAKGVSSDSTSSGRNGDAHDKKSNARGGQESKGNKNARSGFQARGKEKESGEALSSKSDKDLSKSKNFESGKSKKEWRAQPKGETGVGHRKHTTSEGSKNRSFEKKESQPEWFNDYEEVEKKQEELSPSKKMTFDENGNFVVEKGENVGKSELGQKSSSKRLDAEIAGHRQETSEQSKTVDCLVAKINEAMISDTDMNQAQNEIDELNQQFQQTQAQLLLNRLQSSSNTTSPFPVDHPYADKWFYLDSQNQVQGPFTSEQMANWLASGYFSMNLMVKRGCDDKFVPLGLIVQNLNQMRNTPSQPQPKPKATQTPMNSQDHLLQQIHFVSQNNNLLQSHLVNQQKAGLNAQDLNNIVKQIQQIQMQQKAAVASLNTLGVNAVANILQELRSKQEALIGKINITKQNSPIINSLLQQSISPSSSACMASPLQLEKADPLKEKILALFEIKRKEEERRRRLEEEIRVKQEEEKRRLLEEARIKQLILMQQQAQQQMPNVLKQQAAAAAAAFNEQKFLLEQLKLSEVLNAQHNPSNSMLSNFLRQQQSSSKTLPAAEQLFAGSKKTDVKNSEPWTEANIHQSQKPLIRVQEDFNK